MKHIRTINKLVSYYQVFCDSTSLYFCIAYVKLSEPNDTSITLTLESFNRQFYTCFQSLTDIVNQFLSIKEFDFIRLIAIQVKQLGDEVVLFSITQKMYGNTLIEEFQDELSPNVVDYGTSIKSYLCDNIVVTILIDNYELKEPNTTIIAFTDRFIPTFFNTSSVFDYKKILKPGIDLTKKFINFYHNSIRENPEQLNLHINSVARQYKISNL